MLATTSKANVSTHVEMLVDGTPQWESPIKHIELVVHEISREGLVDFSKTRTTPAVACIYCGASGDRTREHIVAYALGGTITFPKGSCKSCQKITHSFETAVLRGPMQMVRYIQDLPSRTKHQDVPETVEILATINGVEQKVSIPRVEAPILLAFPIFGEPTYLSGEESPVNMTGIATCSYGIDPAEVVRNLGASAIRVSSTGNEPVAFARMVAKTAYANAHANGQISRLKNPAALVEAMLHRPNGIGKFVGTMQGPFLKRKGIGHYLGIHEHHEAGVLFATVQFFAASGAPTYVVVLGNLR